MAKEVALKIKVDGQDVNITKENVTLLSKAIESLEQDLQTMGKRTMENAKAWDETKNALEGVTNAYNELTKAENANTDAVKENEQELESISSKIGKLEDKLGDLILKNQQNTEEYKKTATEARRLRDVQEELTIASTKTVDVMASIPGPIGFVFGGIKSLQVGLKSARTAMSQFGMSFKLLDRAIASTGIGAIVVLIGLLVGAIVKAVSSSKVFQEGMERLGKVTEIFGNILQPLIDFIAGTAIAVIEGLAKALLFLTGNLETYNKEIADQKATKEFEANVTYQAKLLDASAHKYDEFTMRKLKANQMYKEKKIELDKDETLSEKQKYALLKLYREQADAEIAQADKDRKKKADDAAKEARDKAKAAAQERLQIENDFQNRLRTFEEEQTLMSLNNEKDREMKTLQFQYEAQLREIDQLKISEKKKQQLRDEANESYLAKQKQTNDKYLQQEKDLLTDLQTQIETNQDNLIQDEIIRAQAQEYRRYEREQKRLQDLIDAEETTEAEREKYRKLQEQNTKMHLHVLDELDERFKNRELQREIAKIDAEANIQNARIGIAYQVAGILGQLAGENKSMQKAALIAEKAVGIADVIVNTKVANAKSVAISPKTLGQPWVTINNISGALGIASIIAAAAQGLAQINAAGQEGKKSGGGSAPNLGRNYAQGGLLDGPRHSQGGIDTPYGELEGGEFVVNRESTKRYLPLLQDLNSNRNTRFTDSLLSRNPLITERFDYTSKILSDLDSRIPQSKQAITKTYIVESELTSMQQRQARLKDLSTL
jgi:hypothetical protein